MRVAAFLLLMLLQASHAFGQQDSVYTPAHRLPASGPEYVLVFFSSSDCVGNKNPELGPSVQRLKYLLAEAARENGHAFRAIGAAIDWSTDAGLDYLTKGVSKWSPQPLGAWDEILLGGNWLGTAATQHVWRAEGGMPSVPQLILVRRNVKMGERGITIEEDEVLHRANGADEIVTWAREGGVLKRPPKPAIAVPDRP